MPSSAPLRRVLAEKEEPVVVRGEGAGRGRLERVRAGVGGGTGSGVAAAVASLPRRDPPTTAVPSAATGTSAIPGGGGSGCSPTASRARHSSPKVQRRPRRRSFTSPSSSVFCCTSLATPCSEFA